MATQPTKRGHRRPVEFVKHPDTDLPVTGLRQHKPSGRYYRIAQDGKTREYYQRNGLRGVAYLRRAVYEHELHLKGEKPPQTIRLTEAIPEVNRWTYPPQPTGRTLQVPVDVRSQAFWDAVRDELLTDRFAFAAKVGVPELAFLDKLRPSGMSLSLDAIGTRYEKKTPRLTDKEKREVRRFWREFCNSVTVKTVAEITAEHIRQYRDLINLAHHNGKSPTYVKRRFCAVKTVLAHAMTEGEDTDNLQHVLTLCKMLVPPRKVDSNPQPITREHFAALLAVASPKWKAAILLALNAAYYPVDVAQVTKTAIDLEAATLRETRTKTGVPRIAVLWGRTIDAIREYQKQDPHDSAFLFINEEGRAYNANHIGRNFRRLRKKATLPDKTKLPDSVEFAHIRDGAQTAAILGGADPVRVDMLLGHKTGQRDDYLKRNPMMVADACAAIERHYFGPELEGKTKKR